MNGPAQIETSSAPSDAVTPHQPGSHRVRKARCERMRLRDICGVHDVTQIGTCEILEARSALAPAATITAVAPTLPAISQPSSGCRSLLIVYLISFPQHSVGRYQIGGDDLHSTLSTRAAARDQDSA